MLYSAQDPDKTGQVGSLCVPASVVQLRYHWDQMFVALANGTVAIFKRNSEGVWDINAPAAMVTLGEEPVICLLPIGSSLYAACGRNVFVIDGITGETLVSLLIGCLSCLLHCSILCIYFCSTAEKFQRASRPPRDNSSNGLFWHWPLDFLAQ